MTCFSQETAALEQDSGNTDDWCAEKGARAAGFRWTGQKTSPVHLKLTWSSPEAHSLMCLRTHSMCHAHLYELTAARTNWTPDVCGGHPMRDVTVTRAKLIISDQRDVPEKMSERSRGNEGKVSEFGSFARVLLNKSGPSSSDALCAFSSSKIKTCNTGTFVRCKVCAGRDDSTARGLCGRMFSP